MRVRIFLRTSRWRASAWAAGGDSGDGGAAGGGFFGGDVVEVVGELGAADVGGAVGVGFGLGC